jgi:hypothetical protein
MRYIERDTIMSWEVEFGKIDPQELQTMEEKAVKNVVEILGEIIFWHLARARSSLVKVLIL